MVGNAAQINPFDAQPPQIGCNRVAVHNGSSAPSPKSAVTFRDHCFVSADAHLGGFHGTHLSLRHPDNMRSEKRHPPMRTYVKGG